MPAEAELFVIQYEHGSLHCPCNSVSGGAALTVTTFISHPNRSSPSLNRGNPKSASRAWSSSLAACTAHCTVCCCMATAQLATWPLAVGQNPTAQMAAQGQRRQRASGTCCICLVSDEAHKRTEAGGALPCDRPLKAVLVHPGERGAATISPILALVPKVVGIEGLSAAAPAPPSSPAQHSIACCLEAMLDSCVAVYIVHLTHQAAQHQASMPCSLSKPRKGFRPYLAAPSGTAGPPRPPRPGKLPLAIPQWKTHADL